MGITCSLKKLHVDSFIGHCAPIVDVLLNFLARVSTSCPVTVPCGATLPLHNNGERERILNLYTAASKQKVLRCGATGRRKVMYLGKQSII